jgi:WD40 repeat protein
VNRVAFSPDGRTAAVGDHRVIRFLDGATWDEVGSFCATAGWLHGLAFSPDGNRVLSVASDVRLSTWEVPTGRRLTRVVRKMPSPLDRRTYQTRRIGGIRRSVAPFYVPAAFEPTSGAVVTADSVGGVYVWQTAPSRKEQQFILDERVVALAFSPSGECLACALDNFDISVWDLAGKREATRLRGHHGQVNILAFSPDGRLLASAGDDTTVLLWPVDRWAAPRPPSH